MYKMNTDAWKKLQRYKNQSGSKELWLFIFLSVTICIAEPKKKKKIEVVISSFHNNKQSKIFVQSCWLLCYNQFHYLLKVLEIL